MHVVAVHEELQRELAAQRRHGHTIGLVPTMGNLHAGHHSLIRLARARCDRVVVSVFVNPTQFAPNEDFARYPRTPVQDAEALRALGCDVLFMPTIETMYPLGLEQGVRVSVPSLAGILDGARRPGHFDGVATVVTKLFNLVRPDIAVFGRKDYQQLLVIRTLVRDLAFATEVIGAPIIREAGGLAMSSRNQYLDADQRARAGVLHAALIWLAQQLRSGPDAFSVYERTASDRLAEAGLQPEYVVVRRAEDLGEPLPGQREDLVLLAAARLGSVRLIDNVSFDGAFA